MLTGICSHWVSNVNIKETNNMKREPSPNIPNTNYIPAACIGARVDLLACVKARVGH